MPCVGQTDRNCLGHSAFSCSENLRILMFMPLSLSLHEILYLEVPADSWRWPPRRSVGLERIHCRSGHFRRWNRRHGWKPSQAVSACSDRFARERQKHHEDFDFGLFIETRETYVRCEDVHVQTILAEVGGREMRNVLPYLLLFIRWLQTGRTIVGGIVEQKPRLPRIRWQRGLKRDQRGAISEDTSQDYLESIETN